MLTPGTIILNTRTLKNYPDDALFIGVRSTYLLHGDRLPWDVFPGTVTKAEILAYRATDRRKCRWEGKPVNPIP